MLIFLSFRLLADPIYLVCMEPVECKRAQRLVLYQLLPNEPLGKRAHSLAYSGQNHEFIKSRRNLSPTALISQDKIVNSSKVVKTCRPLPFLASTKL